MGAAEVIKILEKAKKELTTTEIAQQININHSSVRRIMRCLLKDPTTTICFRELTNQEKIDKYNHSLNLRIRVYKIKK